ncbi:MAG: nucleotidyltransferase family protein [Proteobacteria bacterium]|nr:nucleotidyltransferase family protein [Pseudomonadota bacterium]
MEEVLILIPAAGASSRMRGRDKLMEDVGGETALHRAARIARASGARVYVTLPESGPHSVPRRAELSGLEARALPIRDAHEGMAASLRAGVAAAGSAAGLMVLLPDMPEITEGDLSGLLAAFAAEPGKVHRAAAEDGTPGHPVIFPRRLFVELSVITGDVGGRRVMAGEEVVLHPLAGQRALMDLDTPEDWADWRARY